MYCIRILIMTASLSCLVLSAAPAQGESVLAPTETVTVPAATPAGPGSTNGDIVVRERSSDDDTGSEGQYHISAFMNFDLSGVAAFSPGAGDKAYFGVDFQGRLNTVNSLPLYVGQITGGAWSGASLPSYDWATQSPAPAGPGSQTREHVIVPDVKTDSFTFYAADVTDIVDAWQNGAEPNYGLGGYIGDHNQGAGFGSPVLHIVPKRTTSIYAVIDDDFENGDIATGGVGGGFAKVTNGAGGTGLVTESGTYAAVTTSGPGNDDNTGIVSLKTFDATAQPEYGFTVTWDILRADDPQANGINLMVQSNPGFINDANGKPNLRFQFDQNNDNTFHLVADKGSGTLQLASDPIDLSEVLDGFTLTATVTEAGWSYSATGLDSLADNAGTWSGAYNYGALFDSTTHVGAFIQQGGVPRTLVVDRITVTMVPEPATCALSAMGLWALGLYARRRRR